MTTPRSILLAAIIALTASVSSVVAAESAPRETVTSFEPAKTPTKPVDSNGFIQRWLLLEPIPVNGLVTQNAVQTTVKADYFPNQLSVIPKDADTVTVGANQLKWHALDTKRYNVNLYHFGYMLNKASANSLFWAVTVVVCPEEMRDVRLAIGSNSATVWWVNGEEVTSIYGDRQTIIDDGVSRRITLKKGPNIVRCALVNNGGATDFCARFLDAKGNPIKNLTVNLAEAAK